MSDPAQTARLDSGTAQALRERHVPSAGAAESGFQISSPHNNRCLTVSDYNAANGAGVLMVDGQGATSQLWNWDPQQPLHLRNVHSNKRLTAAWCNGENGAALHMWHCNRDWGSQMFYRPASTPEEVGRLRTMMSLTGAWRSPARTGGRARACSCGTARAVTTSVGTHPDASCIRARAASVRSA
ncbi:ricin-type beta-trefoil lectin protein [Lentzea atacamensis]|uniref:Ricin-type beta-trefoil lectin protein n=1 Tax=Lentzea atacamensis TaxID=531938 RepID=A0ABX9E454_9PSEU|nr:RICIN domain-containing protein [Lentzea atacamensis]RAS63309.1 ricin-type beta-trefoil lectin protein [Lentzea atacamensis]